MPTLAETIRHLQARAASPAGPAASAGSARLRPLTGFGSNPGALNGWFDTPEESGAVPLVVVLHGCTQTAAAYDRGSGWSDLAARYGFAVLFPEQRRENNPNLCFNWFNPDDTRRGGGEAGSIRQMIAAMHDRHAIDPSRVFVTGLSAGGAMTSVMLAAYPEIFAGGGIIAGLPYGAATSIPEALDRMRGQGRPGGVEYADRARAASSHAGPWPTISVWHGDADRTVDVRNADDIIGQWQGLHGTRPLPDRSDTVDGHVRQVWLDHDGREAIESYRIAGMGHGTPLKTAGSDGCGAAGPHMLEAGISSTRHLATRWELIGDRPAREQTAVDAGDAAAIDPRAARVTASTFSVQHTIENALRIAGLLK